MTLPFSVQEFFDVFARYNAAIWPAQLVAYALGAVAVGALWAVPKYSKPVILVVLAIFWGWSGIAYHWTFFSAINPAAYAFGTMFVLQAVLFLAAAVAGSVSFVFDGSLRSAVAAGLILYAAVIYELLGYLAGHGFMNGPLFGVAPCPTTIFTIGMLLLARGAALLWLSLIPLVWAAIGSSAAILLGVPEDLGLTVSLVVLLTALAADRMSRPQRG